MNELNTIKEVVTENPSAAYVLDCYGIEFLKHTNLTVDQICKEKQINVDHLLHNIKPYHDQSTISLEKLEAYPTEFVIEYLKHAHHIFVKRSLPYMLKLVNQLKPKDYHFSYIISDLKLVFPMFVNDFIEHIYEEEDELFNYIKMLDDVKSGKTHYNKIYNLMETFSLIEFSEDHENADDEMRGIRELTSNYSIGIDADLHMKVIYSELKQFETELVFHADVENKILLPKAILTEREIREMIKSARILN